MHRANLSGKKQSRAHARSEEAVLGFEAAEKVPIPKACPHKPRKQSRDPTCSDTIPKQPSALQLQLKEEEENWMSLKRARIPGTQGQDGGLSPSTLTEQGPAEQRRETPPGKF